MNSLLWLAGGGAAAYLYWRYHESAAATPPAGTAPPAGSPPPTSSGGPTVIVVPSSNLPPTPPGTSPPIAASWPPTAQSTTRPAQPSSETPTPKPPVRAVQLSGRWGWPVPRWQGRAPVISDGFGSARGAAKHMGVDLMFARVASDPFPNGPNGSKAFVMPDAWMAVAAGDGVLWSSGPTPRGYAVAIDHGNVVTFYTHLSTLFVPAVKPVSKAGGPPPVQIKAGQPVGVIGADPLDPSGLKHLHFELWAGGPEQAVDPQSLMKTWDVFTPSDVAPFLPAPTLQLARNAKAKPTKRRSDDLVHVGEYLRRYPGTAINFQ